MKRRFNKLLAAALAAALCIPTLPVNSVNAADSIFWMKEETVPVSTINDTERSVNFNGGWKFNLGDSATAFQKEFNDSEWTNISLPHDFSIFQDFTPSGEAESGYLPGGTGWYRKTFSMPASMAGKSIVLNFDGAYKDAYVYVNENLIGEHHYGYTPFALDITEYLTCDGSTENLIAVKVENQIPSSRWYSGSGIYRDVTLIVTNPVHIAKNGTYVTTPDLAENSGKSGTVTIAADVQNDSQEAADITVRNTIYEKGGTAPVASVEAAATVAAGQTQTVSSEKTVSNPKLWSIDEPNLYYVRTEILKGSDVLDTYDTEFGFKWYSFIDNVGFNLNGKNVKINGVCMHHDQGALGSAAYYDAVYRQMSTMKDMGVNTIRVTHNPAAEILVDICNELGLLVIEEAFDGWGIPKNGNRYDFSQYFDQNLTASNQLIDGNTSMTWAEFAIKSMVKRDRNDASIILWSLGNEISEGAGNGYNWSDTADKLLRWINEVDTAHLPTSGSNRRSLTDVVAPVNQKIYEAGGVPGYNYGYFGYPTEGTDRGMTMVELHETYPVFLWSETVSPGNSRGIYTTQASQANADGKYHLTSYDTSCVGWGLTVHDSMYPTLTNDWLAGECMWTGFDYIGEPTPWNGTGTGDGGRGAIPNSSYFGIVETSGFPKDTYYLYRSQWNQKADTLHLVTAWDPNNMINNNGKTPVWIYSNAAKVELYRDDVKVGTATRKALSETTTAAGHVHYEYTTESNNPDLCTTSSGSGSTSLYSVFNVAFESGTIWAKAFDENGNEITENCSGNASVSTPGDAAKLSVSSDKTSITADGASLSYITIDVTDKDDNLKTTASDEIKFTLTGEGEIVGVDNGDQATVNKFQQQSVLTSASSAKIDAFSGKALVIVRSTKQAGSFTLKAESEGLESASVTVTTTAETTGSPQLAFYNIARHCYVPAGSKSIALPETIKAGLSDGSSIDIPVTWNSYDTTKLAQKGSLQISGSFGYSGQTFGVSVTAHVYDPIGGVQGFSLYTEPHVIPALPTSAMVYSTDGSSFEEFPVIWDTSSLTPDSVSESGNIVSVPGTVTALGKTYTTSMHIRVAEGENPLQTNVATRRDRLLENEKYGDNLLSLTNGTRSGTQNQSNERWTTWSRTLPTEPRDDISIAMDWATATLANQINLFFYVEDSETSALPTAVKFEYALSSNYNKNTGWLDASEWIEIGYSDPVDVDGFTNTDNTIGKTYVFNEEINPQALRITFTQPANSFIGLNEIEVIGTTYSYYPKTSAALSIMDGTNEIVLEEGKEQIVHAGFFNQIHFKNTNNAALTFITQDDSSVVKVIALSEDGNDTKTYTIKLTDAPTVESSDKLQDKLDEYKKLDSTLYTSESYNALKSLIAQIESQMGQLSESELQAKLEELNTMKNSLKPAITTNPKPDLTTADKITIANVEYQVLDPAKKTVAAVRLTNKNASKITIQDTVTIKTISCNVVQISDKTFQGAKKLKTVKLGKYVTTIGKNAFTKCKNLKTITFQETNVTIGKSAFKKAKSGITVKGTKKLKGKKKTAFKKKLTKAGMKNPKLR